VLSTASFVRAQRTGKSGREPRISTLRLPSPGQAHRPVSGVSANRQGQHATGTRIAFRPAGERRTSERCSQGVPAAQSRHDDRGRRRPDHSAQSLPDPGRWIGARARAAGPHCRPGIQPGRTGRPSTDRQCPATAGRQLSTEVSAGGTDEGAARGLPEQERCGWRALGLLESGDADYRHDSRYRALVLLAAFGSLRWGEVTALRRCDIDLAESNRHCQLGNLSGHQPQVL